MAVERRKKQLPEHSHPSHTKGVIVIDKSDVEVSPELAGSQRLTKRELYLTPVLFLTPILIYILIIAWLIAQS